MARTELFVIIEGMPAGILRQDSTGQIYFRYADGYRGTPFSLSLRSLCGIRHWPKF